MDKLRHMNKALHNEDFYKSFNIDKTDFKDWIVAGIFYTALHYYEAYFSELGKHSRDHGIYDEWIPNDDKIKNTYSDYQELKLYRWQASYRSKNFKPIEIRTDILPKLDSIKKQILALWGI